MESYAELSYMETSLQLLQIKVEIEGLHKEKAVIEKLIQKKLREQSELIQKNLRFIKIVNKTSGGSDHYSPKKCGVNPPTPQKLTDPPKHVPLMITTTHNIASPKNGQDSVLFSNSDQLSRHMITHEDVSSEGENNSADNHGGSEKNKIRSRSRGSYQVKF